MGRKRKILTDDEMILEIQKEGDRLREAGVDLSKIQIVSEGDGPTKRQLVDSIFLELSKLKSTGADLNIPITIGRNSL